MPATLTVDTTGQICTWSREAEELLGYSASVTTIAAHKTGKLMKLPISVKALYGGDQRIIAVEATFYPSCDKA